MVVRTRALLIGAFVLVASALAQSSPGRKGTDPMGLDPKQAINESHNLLKEREPSMTAAEYAIYQKVVPMVSEQPEFALVLLETMQDDDEPSSPAFKLVLGNVYFSQDRFEQAEKLYEQAIAEYPEFLRAWQNLAMFHYTQGNYQRAVECLSESMALGDRLPRTFGLMGYCLKQTGNALAAEAAYQQALAAAPNEEKWISGLLEIYLDSRQYARAEALARARLEKRPEEGESWMLLASILKRQAREEEAIATMELAASLDLAGPKGILFLGDLYAERHAYRDAARIYRQAARDFPLESAGRLIDFALALVHEGALSEAASLLDSIASHPDEALENRKRFARAQLQIAAADLKEAGQTLQSLLERAPLHGPALLALGRIHAELEQSEEAAFAFEQALADPDSAYEANLELSRLLLKQGRHEKGISRLEEALSLKSSHALREHIARIRTLVQSNNES